MNKPRHHPANSNNSLDQDGNRILEGEHKAVYQPDESGRVRVRSSHGWKVEEVVTSAAVAEFDRLAAQAMDGYRAGRVSALAVYMYRRRLDPGSLAQALGTFRWRVRRHLRPGPFARLSDRWLRRYAEVLGMDLEELRQEP